MSETHYIYDKFLGTDAYQDDIKDEVPVSLNTTGMINGMASMAINSPPGDFMEIGVWRGGASSVLHQIAKEQSRKLYLFDLFESDNCLDTVKRFCPQANIIKGKFPDSWPGNISNISFCLFDIDDDKAAGHLINMIPDVFISGGKVLFSFIYRNDKYFEGHNFITLDGLK